VPRPSDTKQRILAAARELFATQGVQKTSLQDIAGRLGITKPALYYHFSSREELVRSIMLPLVDDSTALIAEAESRGRIEPRELLESYFDFNYGHRAEMVMMLTELPTLVDLGLIEQVIASRERLAALLFPPKPTLRQAARATVALGGLSDCTVQFPDAPVEELRVAAVDAAMDALGL
jgi:AcrR family transcriptional regulator